MAMPSATTLRQPRPLNAGRLFGTNGLQGTNAMQYPNNGLADTIGNNLNGLLKGTNPAADQADRTTLSALGGLQKNQMQNQQRSAVQMGIRPGDAKFNALQAQQGVDAMSMGSKLLGDNTQRRLDDQSKGLNSAITFNQGQQNYGLDQQRFGLDQQKFGLDKGRFGLDQEKFGLDKSRFGLDQNKLAEDTRRYDQDFASKEKTTEVNTLFDIINNQLSSEGQVEAAKQRLLQLQGGLDTGLYNTPEKNAATRQFEEIKSYLSVMNPTLTPEALDKLARERFATLDASTFGALEKATQTDVNKAAATGAPKAQTMGDRLMTGATGAAQLSLAPTIGVAKGAGHVAGETYRGVRDITRGDVLGGAARTVAAPITGQVHGAMEIGRAGISGGKKVLRSIFG